MPEYNEREKAEIKIKQNRTILEICEATFQRRRERFGKPPEMAIGIREIDTHIWGLQKQRLYVVAARPSHGKSSFLIQTAWNLTKQNKKVVYLSLEMSAQAIFERMVCNEFGINPETATFNSKETRMTERMLEHPFLTILEIGGRTSAELQAIYRIYKPDVIIVDYIQQVSVNGKRSKQEAIANYISDCKELSLAYNTVIILASQINRAGASITDGAAIDFMKGAGEIEEAADYLFHLRWIGKEEKDAPINKYQVNLIKNRFGPVQNFTLEFNSEYCRFGKPERKADEFPENKRHSPYGS